MDMMEHKIINIMTLLTILKTAKSHEDRIFSI
jgi:hypothetical protein